MAEVPDTEFELKELSYEAQNLIKATPVEVWTACTTASGLKRWLAEDASISLSEGGDFICYSKSPFVSGRHKVTELVEGEELTLEWFTEGVPGELSIHFVEDKGFTRIKLSHKATRSPASAVFPYLMGQVWEVAIGRLRIYTEQGTEGVKFNAHDSDEVVRISIAVKGDRETIWKALTDTSTLDEYNDLTMDNSKIDLKPGGRFSFGWDSEKPNGDGPGFITDLEEYKTIAATWYGPTESEIRWSIEEKGDEVIVHFKHSKLSGYHHHDVWSYRLGWASSLHALKWFIESGEKK